MALYNFSVIVYRDTSETSIAEAPVVESLDFDTVLPGGYGKASFFVPSTGSRAVKWYKDYFTKHIVIFDRFGNRVYEGRIEDTELEAGGVKVTCFGYYSHGDDLTQGLLYPEGSNKTATDVVEDSIDLTTDWNTTKAFILQLTSFIDPRDYAWGEKIRDAIEDVLDVGTDETPPRPLHFAIWEERTPYFFAEPGVGQRADFSVSVGSILNFGEVSLKLSRSEIYNKIQAYYEDPTDGPALTSGIPAYGWQEDEISQLQFGVREGTLNVGQQAEEVAQLVVDNAIQFYPKPRQGTKLELTGMAKNKAGIGVPIHLIRAGDILELSDFDPFIAQLIGDATDSYSAKAFVRATSYSADENKMTIDLGTRTYAFEILMGQIGQATGIK